GAFEIGDSSDTIMNSIIKRSILLGNPVILVVPNYRVNVSHDVMAFGFLMGREVEAAGVGKLGLCDQRFALQWVQEHIYTFRGELSCMLSSSIATIYSSSHSSRLSAGAISVGMHLVASHADHLTLFSGAFMESGATSIPPLAHGQPQYDQLVTDCDCTHVADTLDCLRHVPFETLMTSINRIPNIFSYTGLGNVWKPRVDG
ncbi:Alpha/Beta hydrolase protein, partial [Mycena sp. CBHHK59/15]